MTDHAYSESYLEANRAEADRLAVEAERLRAEAAEHVATADRLSSEALAIEQHVRDLDELLGRAPQLRLDVEPEGLRGQRLRQAAIEILARRLGLNQPIHYRDWYRLVREEAGQEVEAKDPLATFLVQVSRSPFVAKADEPGVYLLDPDRAGEQALAGLQAAEATMREAEQGYADVRRRHVADGDPSSIEARRRLDASRRRLAQAQRDVSQIARNQSALRELAEA